MQQTCRQCSASFEITDADLAFYEKVSPVFQGKKELIPPPTLCFDCRQQRKMAWRNEKKLYHRTCDLTGKQILSIYAPDKPYIVYNFHDWCGDQWDPMAYGREFDFSRPFFEQFDELHHDCPLRSFNMHDDNENSDFTNLSHRNKNCYLIFAAAFNEDCYYNVYIQRNKNIVDCFFVFNSELCYECIDCYHCTRLRDAQFCENCSDSSLLFSCKSCKDCLGCVSLVNKQYYILNKPYSKEDYEKYISHLREDNQAYEALRTEFEALKLSIPHKYYAGIGNEQVTGDHVSYSKNVGYSFDCTQLEDCKHCTWLHESKDCQDCYAWGVANCELGYENHLCGETFQRVLFSESCWRNIQNLLYCRYCLDGCHDCFGCISLRKKQYCIFNKQYTKEEYEELVPKIIERMRQDKEWGEFFPQSLSPYGYNETVANEYMPLTKEEALQKGWKWYDEEERILQPNIVDIPTDIRQVSDDICNKVLACEVTGRPYKITPQELAFYRLMSIPIPKKCFDERHKERMAMRNPRKLWKRPCMQCSKEMETTYSPDRPEIIYCEECYLKTVY